MRPRTRSHHRSSSFHLRMAVSIPAGANRSRRLRAARPSRWADGSLAGWPLPGNAARGTQRAPPPCHCPAHSARGRLNTPTQAFEASAPQLTCAIHTPRHSSGFSSSRHLCNQSGRAPHSPGSRPGAAQGLQDARLGPLHTALWCTQGSWRQHPSSSGPAGAKPPRKPLPTPFTSGTEKQNLYCWKELKCWDWKKKAALSHHIN